MYVSDTFTLALQFRAGWSPRSWRTWACPGTGARVDMREGVKGKGGSAGDESQVVMMQPVSPPSVWRAVVQVQQLYLVHTARAVHQLCLTFPPWCLHVAHWMESHTDLKERWAWLRWLEPVFSQLRSLPSIADLTLIHSVDYFGTAWYHVVDLSSSTCYWFHKGPVAW